ncbi:MAG TPA: CvpA family protein [Rhizomicrobium sp.]|jgi:membrane protein required for colicin V production
MSDLHITWMDLFVVAVVVISMGFAIARGFVRETLSMFSWAAAAFATLYFGRYLVPLMAPHFSPLVAEIAAYSTVFVLVLLPLSFIGHRIAQNVRSSQVGPLDRSLGGAFGILRGLALIAILYIGYSLIVPVHAQGAWIGKARSLPLIQKSAKVLLSLIPSDQAQYVQNRTEKTKTANYPDENEKATSPSPKPAPHSKRLKHPAKVAQTKKPAHPARKGYGAKDRRELNRLIEASGHGGK